MKFSAQFEFHKIPEWYSEYLDYKRFKAMLKTFKLKVKGMTLIPLIYRWRALQVERALQPDEQALCHPHGYFREN